MLELFSEQYPIDLVPIPLHEIKVIIGMDRLIPNGEMIDCEHQLFRVRNLSRGELFIHSEGAQWGPALCLAARASLYLQQGCSSFVDYVLDTREEGKRMIDDVSIIREYPGVFPEDFLGVPP